MTIAIIIIIFVIAAIFIVQLQNRAADKPTSQPGKKNNPFRAVSIRSGLTPCTAAQKLSGRRYFLNDAPALPLEGCDAANCECRFVRHADRREDYDRRTPLQRNFALIAERMASNRREQEGRRDADAEDELH